MKSEKIINIVIADDHSVVRQGVKEILSHESDISVVGEAKNSEEVLECAAKLKPDLIILDISMPGKSGLEILDSLKIISPGIPVLILSFYPENQFAMRFLKAGAAGYINKNMEPEELILAIRTVLRGTKYISHELADKLFWESDVQNKGKALHEFLSDREFEVFRMLIENHTITEIAGVISLSVKTISTYKSRIFIKLKVKNLEEMKKYAQINNLFQPIINY